MTKITKPKPSSEPVPYERPENTNDHSSPEWYLFEIGLIKNDLALDRIAPVDANRKITAFRELAKTEGLDLQQASLEKLDPQRRLLANLHLAEHSNEELHAMKASIAAIEPLNVTERTVKKKWLDLIDLTLELQAKALENPVYFSVYVLRCQETNNVLTFEEIHIGIFEAWNDPDRLNSLAEAPPGIGKTTCLYGQNLWDFKDDQKLRCLKCCNDLPTARKRLGVVREYIDNPRFKALVAHVKINHEKPDNADEFTLMRENVGSQDPSMIAKGATSALQGAGLDRLDFDDLCNINVRHEPSTRERIWGNFFGVGLRRRRNFITSRVRYICTPWHPDDVAGRIIKLVKNGEMVGWRIDTYPVKENDQGVPIPVVKRAGLLQELITIKAADPVTYACCYRLNPQSQALRTLKKFVYYDASGGADPLCPEDKRRYWSALLTAIKGGEQWQVFDPAAGGADKTCAVGFSLSARGRAAITSANFWNVPANESIPLVCDVVTQNDADKVLLEDAGGMKGVADIWGAMLIAVLGEDYRNRVFYSGTRLRDATGTEVGRNVKKEIRYANASPYLSNGVIMFPGKWVLVKEQPTLVCVDDTALTYLHDQLLNYPNTTRDDGVDAVSLFINYNVGRLVRSVKGLRKPTVNEPTSRPISYMTHLYREQQAEKKKQRELLTQGGRNEERAFFSPSAA